MKCSAIELLAILENLRIIHENDKNTSPDFCFRVASAVVASAFGYNDRYHWTEKVKQAGFVEYSLFDSAEQAKENYKALRERTGV